METGADIQEQAFPEGPGVVVRLLPVAVLVLSRDRCFRAAATMLLSRRGCSVLSAAGEAEALAMVAEETVDVLVVELDLAEGSPEASADAIAGRIDSAGAHAGRRVAAVGIVVVGEAEELGSSIEATAGATRPVLDKWGPFERLYQAVCDRDRARRLVRAGDESAWPPAARRRRAV
jgi:CheY-like chemotaxis protein